MNKELKDALAVIAIAKQDAVIKRYELINLFRKKISLLISQTPTGELRNELSELNILYETILVTDSLLEKL